MIFRNKLEVAANAATVLAAVVLSVVLIKVYLLPRRPLARSVGRQGISVGARLNSALPGIDWRKNGRTLVLAISTQCHFCTESAPFFRTLASRAQKGVKIVAVLPQPVDAAQRYLDGEGVYVDRIEQLALSRIGVTGTPTILLVNSSGRVIDIWVGKLQPNQQQNVLATVDALVKPDASNFPPQTADGRP